MVSIDEVARAAGVSNATVSRALSGRGHVSAATRTRVEEAAARMGYVVSSAASSLASGRMRSIGVMVPDLHRWFFSTVLTGISEELSRRGFDLMLYNVTDDDSVRAEIFGSYLRRRRVDGLIVVAMELSGAEISQLQQLDVPVITLGGANDQLPGLAIDHHAVARLATEHLLRLGHERIGRIGALESFDRDFHIPARREAGFREAMDMAQAAVDPTLCVPGDFTIEGGHQAAKRILGRSAAAPTALLAFSDEMAVGATLAARELGLRVPEDVSVIGIDGHDLGGLIGLTTVDQHPLDQGTLAAQRILAMCEEPGGDAGTDAAGGASEAAESADELPYELVVRSSTAAPRPV